MACEDVCGSFAVVLVAGWLPHVVHNEVGMVVCGFGYGQKLGCLLGMITNLRYGVLKCFEGWWRFTRALRF